MRVKGERKKERISDSGAELGEFRDGERCRGEGFGGLASGVAPSCERFFEAEPELDDASLGYLIGLLRI
jgi:hypothetical protein